MAEYPQDKQKHPESVRADLNPDHMAGQNIGNREDLTPASDIKDLVSNVRGFTMDELRQILVVAPGARLEQGATYVDLADLDRNEFTATGAMVAGRGQWLVPKKEAPAPFWNRILGVEPVTRRQ
jgi:hypothetical protein